MVLVVEDDRDAADLLVEVAAAHGICALAAPDVRRAIKILGGIACDAVVTDYAMPGEDGLRLLAYIRSEPGLDGLTCAMVSGQGDHLVERQARALGALWYPKPVDAAALMRALVDELEASHGGAARGVGEER